MSNLDDKIKAEARAETSRAQLPEPGISAHEHFYIKGAAFARGLMQGELDKQKEFRVAMMIVMDDTETKNNTLRAGLERTTAQNEKLRADLAITVAALNNIAMLACSAAAYTSKFTEMSRNIATTALDAIKEQK